ncbi:hypothetical protein PTKIN_Ptkin16aG0047000 [Pterospermum kingtungense]
MAEPEPEIVQEKKRSKQKNVVCGQKRIRTSKPGDCSGGKSKDNVVELWDWLNSDHQNNQQTCSGKAL